MNVPTALSYLNSPANGATTSIGVPSARVTSRWRPNSCIVLSTNMSVSVAFRICNRE